MSIVGARAAGRSAKTTNAVCRSTPESALDGARRRRRPGVHQHVKATELSSFLRDAPCFLFRSLLVGRCAIKVADQFVDFERQRANLGQRRRLAARQHRSRACRRDVSNDRTNRRRNSRVTAADRLARGVVVAIHLGIDWCQRRLRTTLTRTKVPSAPSSVNKTSLSLSLRCCAIKRTQPEQQRLRVGSSSHALHARSHLSWRRRASASSRARQRYCVGRQR